MSNFNKERLKRIDDWMDGYVEEGKFPGSTMLLAEGGEIVHRATTGWMDVEAQKPFKEDTIVRIFSMTKPITSVALMMLAEKGDFHLDAPLSDFIPEFKDMEALIPGATSIDQTKRCATPTLAQAATHTSGLSYSFNPTPLAEKYTDLRQDFGPANGTLEGMAAQAGSLPLAFKPGTEWHYSVGIDILGRVIEVASGKTLDVFFQEEIFDPLDMEDTFFTIPDDKLDRFANLYTSSDGDAMALGAKGTGTLRRVDDAENSAYRNTQTFSGGGRSACLHRRLFQVRRHAKTRRRTEWSPLPFTFDPEVHAAQSFARRHFLNGAKKLCRDADGRRRVRHWLVGHAGPCLGAHAWKCWRLQLGRHGIHHLLE